MHGHDAAYAVLHWFWVAFFALFGVLLLIKPRFLAVDGIRLSLRGLRESEQWARAMQALQRRTEAEHISPLPGYIGGGGALVIAAVSAFAGIRPVVFYAVFSLWISVVIAMMFLQLHNVQPKRVAVLTPRSSFTVIPTWIVAGALLNALGALTYVTQHGCAVIAVVICCSALVTLAVAWRLTQLPALLQGDDLAAEIFVDNRLRVHRSAGPLILSVVQPFALSSLVVQENDLQFAAMLLSTAVFACVAVWSLRCFYKPATLATA